MKISDFRQDIEGYSTILNEIDVLKKYHPDYRNQRGQISRIVNRYHPSRIAMKVVGVTEETESSKTFRLASQDRYLPPFSCRSVYQRHRGC